MSILVDSHSRIVVQGMTGYQGEMDTRFCLAYGSSVVCGVTPGRGGERLLGLPVYNTVARAVAEHGANIAATYVPAPHIRDAVLEAIDSGVRVIVAMTENLPRHLAAEIVGQARRRGVTIVGFNTNGIISPTARCKVGGIGGDRPDTMFVPGSIGVCSRSGGMSAEISWTLKQAGFGVSTCVSMGGDAVTGLTMAEYAELFEQDPATRCIVIFGEPGSTHEQELSARVAAGDIRKPVIALIAGTFQDAYPKGTSFGHFAAMVADEADFATAKQRLLAASGVHVVASFAELVGAVRDAIGDAGDLRKRPGTSSASGPHLEEVR